MTRVRVAVIGAGKFAAAVHYPSLKAIPECEAVGLCDLSEARLAEIGGRFGIGCRFTDYRRMVDELRPAAVYILLQPQHLAEPVDFCLSRGLHVFVEKPPGISVPQLAAWMEKAEKNGCKSMVGFNRRFAPVIQEARRRVEEGGAITQCVARYYKNQTYEECQPFLPDIPHGILLYDAIHSVDFLRWVGGRPAAVRSDVRRVGRAYLNSFNALVRFEEGCAGVLSTHFASGGRVEAFELHGYARAALIEPPFRFTLLEAGGKRTVVSASELTGVPDSQAQACSLGDDGVTHRIFGFLQESRHFIGCILDNRRPSADFRDALETMKLVELIAEDGEWRDAGLS